MSDRSWHQARHRSRRPQSRSRLPLSGPESLVCRRCACGRFRDNPFLARRNHDASSRCRCRLWRCVYPRRVSRQRYQERCRAATARVCRERGQMYCCWVVWQQDDVRPLRRLAPRLRPADFVCQNGDAIVDTLDREQNRGIKRRQLLVQNHLLGCDGCQLCLCSRSCSR